MREGCGEREWVDTMERIHKSGGKQRRLKE
jgi:hypothetical protein